MFYKKQPLTPLKKKHIRRTATRTIKISSSCKHHARNSTIIITADYTLKVYKIAYRHKASLTKKNRLTLSRECGLTVPVISYPLLLTVIIIRFNDTFFTFTGVWLQDGIQLLL